MIGQSRVAVQRTTPLVMVLKGVAATALVRKGIATAATLVLVL